MASDLPVVAPDSVHFDSGYLVPNRDKGKDVTLDPVEYLTNILLSNVYDVAVESPFQKAALLSERLEVNVWIKRDDLQPVFSFKLRGAYNMMSKLPREQRDRGVITASAGNHAQGVALSARELRCTAIIAMPTTTPEIKVDAVRRLGGTVVLEGETFDDAQAYALRRAEEEGLLYIPPFDHQDIIIGQGTVGMEIVRQRQEPIEAIFVPIGGGGLISGIAAYVTSILPGVKIIGVEPFEANGMALSFHYGQRVALEWVGNFADGVAVRVVGQETYNVCRQLVDGVVLVDSSQISAAIRDIFEETRNIVEPSGAVALAGAKAYCNYYGIKRGNVIAVTSGANVDFDRLKLVVDLADIGNDREALMASYLPEEPGSFKRFVELFRS
ncbi:Threonine/serine dehydratase [Handroanthus impetiginosus]|uniref:Threonine dehydratase n=1 Tax=Handroanthus impetiginosus TaxID=429701 RepID=A0A2G9GIM1_9LAMI|nr:Threonine/serine dehydratase [Handroanthus impetiginosus]